MGQLILLQQFKIFKMKFHLFVLSFFIVGYSNAQIMPPTFIANNNTYPASISSNTSFAIQSVTSGLTTNSYPAIKSEFSWTFNNTTPYTIQFMVTKTGQTTTNGGFIGFTTAVNGLSYSSSMFYEFNGGNVLRNFVNTDYLNDNIPFSNTLLGSSTGTQITTTYDGTNWRNYVNGQLKTTTRNTATWSSTGNLMIGNVGGYTNIIIDEVRFWNKVLTADEINKNWNKSLTGYEDGLKLYYNFNNQGYASENNTSIKYLTDITVNNKKGTFTNLSLTGTQQNFVTDIAQTNIYDSSIIILDANILDSYPGNDHSTSYGNTNNKSAFLWHDIYSSSNVFFFKSISYNVSDLIGPVLNADGGRSLLISNIYGKSNNYSFISGYGRRTFEAWVKFNSLNNNSVVSIGNLANNDLFEMAVNNGKLILNTGADFASNLNIKSNRTLLANTWYHIVIVYDPYLELSQIPTFFTIYINGTFDNDYYTALNANQTSIDAVFKPINTTNTNIYIGNSLRPFNGKLGSLKIYKRVLSASEVLNRYNATKDRYGY
jgi:hypothetical protein